MGKVQHYLLGEEGLPALSGYRPDDVMIIDHELWDKVIARLDCIEECATHTNLRVHMVEKWISTYSKPSAMKALVEFCIAVIPKSEMEKILSGEVRPPEEDLPK